MLAFPSHGTSLEQLLQRANLAEEVPWDWRISPNKKRWGGCKVDFCDDGPASSLRFYQQTPGQAANLLKYNKNIVNESCDRVQRGSNLSG
jgi:hypothetical protein